MCDMLSGKEVARDVPLIIASADRYQPLKSCIGIMFFLLLIWPIVNCSCTNELENVLVVLYHDLLFPLIHHLLRKFCRLSGFFF